MWFGAFATLASLFHQGTEPRLPAWMAGCWAQQEGDRWVEECWSVPRGGTMIGYSRTGRGNRLVEWEMLRITLDDSAASGHAVTRMTYRARPGGGEETMFAWSAPDEPTTVTFYNAAHDYPQRIRYRRSGDVLTAEISLQDGSRARSWRYRRVDRR